MSLIEPLSDSLFLLSNAILLIYIYIYIYIYVKEKKKELPKYRGSIHLGTIQSNTDIT